MIAGVVSRDKSEILIQGGGYKVGHETARRPNNHPLSGKFEIVGPYSHPFLASKKIVRPYKHPLVGPYNHPPVQGT